MRRIVKRPSAREDLIEIWQYTFEEWGEQQADKYIDEIETGIAKLRDHPELGRARDEVRRGYRSLAVNHHAIFYVLDGDVIRIVRVLHARMDPDTHL